MRKNNGSGLDKYSFEFIDRHERSEIKHNFMALAHKNSAIKVVYYV